MCVVQFGTKGDPGLGYRVLEDLLWCVSEAEGQGDMENDIVTSIDVSLFEVYGDKPYDLLNVQAKANTVKRRDDGTGDVEGLTAKTCSSTVEFRSVLEEAANARSERCVTIE